MTVLTLTRLGPMMLDVPRDPAWKTTSLGPAVVEYLGYLADRRLSPHTIALRERVLAIMCERLDGKHFGCATPGEPLRTCPDCMTGKQGRANLNRMLVRDEWKDVQASSLGTYIGVLKAFWGWACDEELVLRDPAKRIDPPAVVERQHSLFTPEEHARLVGEQPFTRDRVALMLHFEFAMRANDLRLLQLGDIDTGRRSVRLKHGKGRTDRTLSFRTPTVLEAVNAYLMLDRQGHPDEYLLYPMHATPNGCYTPGVDIPAESKRGEPYREPLGDGRWMEYRERPGRDRTGQRWEPFSPTGLLDWWGRCLKRAGVPHRRMHDARHTTGTRLVGEGVTFRTVSKFMRHASLNTTELYVHLNELERMQDELWRGE